ncbi:TPA: MoaD/ThiS family protein [archaeon]|uniref:MoaD/ThiS family protein n=1 Tax=Candidatus Naiadarchaeum limnaeum TaxID=2756139 RepID=A0A832XHW5_9ARCH|nr:MoaD/ThiS family protein [Candidatus Naiadarchaeales archaeon SRR2090153.bin1042]HIJ99945.1 MoaD/ThiS family protein [Candidatus Naiadarchaeum limnaeum]
MKIEVKFDGKTENLDLPSGATVLDVFKKLNLSTEVYLAKIGKDIVIEQEKISENDRVELIKVISGG